MCTNETDDPEAPLADGPVETVRVQAARLLAEHIMDGCTSFACDPPQDDSDTTGYPHGQHPFFLHLADVLHNAGVLAQDLPLDETTAEPAIDVPYLEHQRDFQLSTFGPGQRTAGVLDHIRRELAEIEADPDDIVEWADVIILTTGGAMRRGFTPAELIAAVRGKQARNESRTWPDWRTADPDKAIEHDRTTDDDLAETDTTAAQFDAMWAEGTDASPDFENTVGFGQTETPAPDALDHLHYPDGPSRARPDRSQTPAGDVRG